MCIEECLLQEVNLLIKNRFLYLERLVSTIVRGDILGKQKIIMDRGTFCHTLVRNSQEGIDPFFFIAVLYTLLIN